MPTQVNRKKIYTGFLELQWIRRASHTLEFTKEPNIESRVTWVRVDSFVDNENFSTVWWPGLLFSSHNELQKSISGENGALKKQIFCLRRTVDTRTKYVVLFGNNRPGEKLISAIPPDKEEEMMEDFYLNVDRLQGLFKDDKSWNEAYNEATRVLFYKDVTALSDSIAMDNIPVNQLESSNFIPPSPPESRNASRKTAESRSQAQTDGTGIEEAQKAASVSSCARYQPESESCVVRPYSTIEDSTSTKSPKRRRIMEATTREATDIPISDDVRNRENPVQSSIGILEAVRICQGGSTSLTSDSIIVDFMDREFKISLRGSQTEEHERVPLLDKTKGTIVGQSHDNFELPIDDPKLMGRIGKALKNLKFHVIFDRNLSEKRKQKYRKQGKSEEEINCLSMAIHKNCSMKDIIWRADDPELYSLMVRSRRKASIKDEGQKHTMASYYKNVYGITLQYPKLPIISIGKNNYFPIEFLFRALQETKAESQLTKK